MAVTNREMWKYVQEAFNFPPDMPVVGFNLNLNAANDVVKVTVELYPSHEHVRNLMTVLKQYNLVEAK